MQSANRSVPFDNKMAMKFHAICRAEVEFHENVAY